MTRIIAGTAGGRQLKTPPGAATRPTTDRVREALFSSLESSFGSLDGLRVLDLYAGSGAIGLEALSRGATSADLVERDKRTAALIRANAQGVGLAGATVHATTAEAYVKNPPPQPFDIVFLDPPYELETALLESLLAALGADGWLAEDAMVIVERSKRGDFTWPATIDHIREKKYGETILWYGQPHG
ncbi:MAG: methyltransferase [Nocardioidaceae bacterium]|nr:methyltransferase [Nocardioidaceae bacterium]